MAGLDLFRYKSAADYYDTGKIPYSWNPWKIANLIEQYFSLIVWGGLFILQLLSLFKVAATGNAMVWYFALMIGGIVSVTTGILRYIAYEGAYSNLRYIAYEGVYADNSDVTMSVIKTDTMYAAFVVTAFGLALYTEHKNWWYA